MQNRERTFKGYGLHHGKSWKGIENIQFRERALVLHFNFSRQVDYSFFILHGQKDGIVHVEGSLYLQILF